MHAVIYTFVSICLLCLIIGNGIILIGKLKTRKQWADMQTPRSNKRKKKNSL